MAPLRGPASVAGRAQNGGGLFRSATWASLSLRSAVMALGGVVGAGVSTLGHHHAAVPGGLDGRWFIGPQRGGQFTQLREEMLAARIGDIRMPGWAGPDDRAIGQFPEIHPDCFSIDACHRFRTLSGVLVSRIAPR